MKNKKRPLNFKGRFVIPQRSGCRRRSTATEEVQGAEIAMLIICTISYYAYHSE